MAPKTRTNRNSAGGKGGGPYNTTNKIQVKLCVNQASAPGDKSSLPVGMAQEAAAVL